MMIYDNLHIAGQYNPLYTPKQQGAVSSLLSKNSSNLQSDLVKLADFHVKNHP